MTQDSRTAATRAANAPTAADAPDDLDDLDNFDMDDLPPPHMMMDPMMGGEAPSGTVAQAGEALPEGAKLADQETIVAALRSCYDPEIPVNIYDIGLIYGIHQDPSGNIAIDMTLTSPACPVAGILPHEVAQAVAASAGVGEVEVSLTWDPPWNPSMMSEDAKLLLDIPY